MVKERTRKTRFVFKLSEIKKKVRISGFRETQEHESPKTKKDKHSKRDLEKMLQDDF